MTKQQNETTEQWTARVMAKVQQMNTAQLWTFEIVLNLVLAWERFIAWLNSFTDNDPSGGAAA